MSEQSGIGMRKGLVSMRQRDARASFACSSARGGARNRTDLLAVGPEIEQDAASFCCAYLKSSPVAPSI